MPESSSPSQPEDLQSNNEVLERATEFPRFTRTQHHTTPIPDLLDVLSAAFSHTAVVTTVYWAVVLLVFQTSKLSMAIGASVFVALVLVGFWFLYESDYIYAAKPEHVGSLSRFSRFQYRLGIRSLQFTIVGFAVLAPAYAIASNLNVNTVLFTSGLVVGAGNFFSVVMNWWFKRKANAARASNVPDQHTSYWFIE